MAIHFNFIIISQMSREGTIQKRLLSGRREQSRRSCNLTQEARWALTQGVGRFALGGRGFLPPSAAGGSLPDGSRGLQKGVQDTRTCVPVSYTPSCDSP